MNTILIALAILLGVTIFAVAILLVFMDDPKDYDYDYELRTSLIRENRMREYAPDDEVKRT